MPPPDTSAQMAWEDGPQGEVSVCSTPTDDPGPDQYSPLDRPTPLHPGEKKE
jgi:hypothetical protein